MARALLKEHHLDDWTVRTDTVKSRAGACYYEQKAIRVSRHIVEYYPDEIIRGVVLHEIAHALLPEDEGHSKRWEALTIKLGGVLKVTDDDALSGAGRRGR
jgi:predicted metal-dependent hydrolase